jgi:hypothetical protein
MSSDETTQTVNASAAMFGAICPSTGSSTNFNWFPDPVEPCAHEIDDVLPHEDGGLVGECIECGDSVRLDVGLLAGLDAEVMGQLSTVLGDDVDAARVALGQLAPRVREARKSWERIERMMAHLEDRAEVR